MGRVEANIRKKFLEGKLVSQNRRKLIKRDRETIERGMGVRTRVSFQRANRLGNKHPVRTIFETETHFVLLLRSWSNELFERYTRRVIELVNYSSLVSLAVIKGSGSEMARAWYGTVVESNWAGTLIGIGCSKFFFFDCIWRKIYYLSKLSNIKSLDDSLQVLFI